MLLSVAGLMMLSGITLIPSDLTGGVVAVVFLTVFLYIFRDKSKDADADTESSPPIQVQESLFVTKPGQQARIALQTPQDSRPHFQAKGAGSYPLSCRGAYLAMAIQ